MDSKRLPGKHLLMLNGKTVLEHIIYRAKLVGADEVILAIPAGVLHEPLAQIGHALNIAVYMGEYENVDKRIADACDFFGIDAFVNFDGDDPFCDVKLMQSALHMLKKEILTRIISGPKMVTGGFTYAKLRSLSVKDFLPFIIENSDYSNDKIRLTLDYPEDYAFFQAIFKEMNIQKNNLSVPEIVRFLRTRPDIVAINSHMKEAWLEHKAAT
jgi:spore coat polysaccharide biosynthesis protein SpsF (cytidylyltransferase family)